MMKKVNKAGNEFGQPHHPRPQWRTRLGFVFAALGSAVGLGNIWRFSYLCYKNGGGAFLIPYLIALFVVGIPLMILELGLGHRMRGSAPMSFAKISRSWEWLGWWAVKQQKATTAGPGNFASQSPGRASSFIHVVYLGVGDLAGQLFL